MLWKSLKTWSVFCCVFLVCKSILCWKILWSIFPALTNDLSPPFTSGQVVVALWHINALKKTKRSTSTVIMWKEAGASRDTRGSGLLVPVALAWGGKRRVGWTGCSWSSFWLFFLYCCYFTPVCSKTALMSSVCQVCCAFRKGTHCVCLRHLALAAPWQNFSCLLHLLGRGPYNSSSFFPDISSIFSMCCVRQDVWGGFSLSVTISTEPSGNLLSQTCASKSRHLCALLSQVGVLKQLIK